MRTGEEITITAGELVAGGDAIARIDGFPVFASGVFPGDVALVRLSEVKKGFAKADLVHLVTPSPWRRAEPCPVASTCGGCDWTALRLDKQLDAKKQILVESLRRIGKFDPASLPEITIHPSPLNYRIRSRLHSDGRAVGFYAMRSNDVVQLPEECEVVGVATAIAASRADGLAPLSFWEIDGKLIPDRREITMRVNEFTYRLSTDSFFQVNRHLFGTMIRLVTAHAARTEKRHMALDLYAGAGFFTLPLAQLFERVIAVEGSPESAKYARINAPRNVRVSETPVEIHAARMEEADFIFLDPPRAGARKEVIDAVGDKAREIICYLSCDPVTFSRDANRLTASGWRLSTLDLLDLFPNTHHVETLSSFERAR
ncbi:MAG: class I SAM-dependent RNA methyltransferase [Thermoanaerobaculia bacterium]|nr:class I SAM-dependent RNA methyltransferase [Thermoanaerobaculia bacterium]